MLIEKQTRMDPDTVAKILEAHIRKETGDKSITITAVDVFVTQKDNTQLLSSALIKWKQYV